MKWAQSTEKDEGLMSFIRLAPNPRYLSGEPSNAQAFSFSSACKFAAASGDLEILKLLRAYDFPWSSAVTAFAAYGGNLETLKW